MAGQRAGDGPPIPAPAIAGWLEAAGWPSAEMGDNCLHPLSATQKISVASVKAASGTCRSLRGSGDVVGRQAIAKLI
jgi:hypothetical protein